MKKLNSPSICLTYHNTNIMLQDRVRTRNLFLDGAKMKNTENKINPTKIFVFVTLGAQDNPAFCPLSQAKIFVFVALGRRITPLSPPSSGIGFYPSKPLKNLCQMGGASKILMLLSTPFPLLCPRPSSAALRLARHSRTAALSPFSSSPHPFSNSTPILLHPKSPFKSHLHSQPAAQREPYADSSLPSSTPITRGSASPGVLWPEWARLVENLTAGGYSGRGVNDDDEFVVLERMPEEFARTAEACLAFARDRPDALR